LEFEKCCIRAQVWDTAGQERFAKVTRAYYRDAVGAAIIFDVTNRQSFANVKAIWLNELKSFGHENMRILLGLFFLSFEVFSTQKQYFKRFCISF
jgi:GTPase SAR1 family protein